MNIPKAIEILTYSFDHRTILLTQPDVEALKLGIEALKRIISCRGYTFNPMRDELPSETKD